MNEIKEVRMASSSNRIDWIDIAKGIAIILEIIGHTVKFGSGIRNFIFHFTCLFCQAIRFMLQRARSI